MGEFGQKQREVWIEMKIYGLKIVYFKLLSQY